MINQGYKADIERAANTKPLTAGISKPPSDRGGIDIELYRIYNCLTRLDDCLVALQTKTQWFRMPSVPMPNIMQEECEHIGPASSAATCLSGIATRLEELGQSISHITSTIDCNLKP